MMAWIFAFCLFFTLLNSYGEKIMIEYLVAKKNDLDCKVFFFKGWGTYNHPVKPMHPLSYEEALNRDGFYRAWMCGSGDDLKFLLFEGMELSSEDISLTGEKTEQRFSEAIVDHNGKVSLGDGIAPEKTIELSKFIYKKYERDSHQLKIMTQRISLKYEYEYLKDGALKRVTITNDDGEVSVLDY